MKKIFLNVMLILLLISPTIATAQTLVLDLSSPQIGPSLIQEKTAIYEWTSKSIHYGELYDSLYYAVGKSSLDMNTFISKFTAKKKVDEGYFAYKHFITQKSPTETVLEIIPISKPGFLVGYDFRKIIQFERLILKKNQKSGITITSYLTWIPSNSNYYEIIDRYKEIVKFDFDSIRANGNERLEQIGTPKVTVPTFTVKGIEKKYNEYRIGKSDATNGNGTENNIKSIILDLEFTKKISKDVTLYLTTDGSDQGGWNKKDIDLMTKNFTGYKKTTYKNATIYSSPITSDGYYEVIVLPSKKLKGVYYVGNIRMTAEHETDYDYKLKKEQYNKFMPDVKTIRDEMISILPSVEKHPNIVKY